MSCADKIAMVNQAKDALAIGDGSLIKKLIDFLGSEQFGNLLALIIKLGGLFGSVKTAAADESSLIEASGVNFESLEDALAKHK